MTIPIFTLTRQYRTIRKEIDAAVRQVLTDGNFILGKNVAAFEQEFAAYIGTPYAVGVASGTDALILSLRAHDIGKGDEVIIPANVYPTAFPVAMTGATVRLVDCKDDGLMDIDKLATILTKRTRAIIPVHLYGNPVDVRSINRFIDSNRSKIIVIEDTAQAHGTEINIKYQISNIKYTNHGAKNEVQKVKGKTQYSAFGIQHSKLAGSIGDVGCFSFYPTKNVGAYGDGGMVVSGNKRLIDRIRRLRMYGEEDRYQSTEVSGVSRLDELQAAILRVKLRHLPQWLQRRRAIASYYFRELEGVGDIRWVNNEAGIRNQEYRSSYHLFVIRTEKRDRLAIFLKNHGIGTGIHYPVPVHLTRAFRNLGYRQGDFPVSESLSREILSLPVYPELTDNEVATVVSEIKTFYHG